ncbi:MAG: hypothetical protein EU530_05825 [Promethearchaeota archaeon]|nr:MAG: hypothetical protein EU530_05825 [Candidatus Lokiarchaeota archaeon]
MFKEIVGKLEETRDTEIKLLMKESILHIFRIVQPPSVTSIATNARLIMSDTHMELKKWIENNRERFKNQRNLFSDFLLRIQSLQLKVNQLG